MHAAPLLVRTCTAIAAAATLAATGPAGTAAAAPPVVDSVDRTFVNQFLSGECGVEVVQHLWGSYSTVSRGDRTITSFRFRSTLTAGDVVVDSRAFGPTIEEVGEDGSFTVVQLGVTMRNVPGGGTVGPFAGRTVRQEVRDEDGELVSELLISESGYRQDLAELCAVLRG